MITSKAKEYIGDHSTNLGAILGIEHRVDIYHTDDDFTSKGTHQEYIVGTATRYKYLKKKRKGQSIPPFIELDDLNILVETILKEAENPISTLEEEDEEVESYTDSLPVDSNENDSSEISPVEFDEQTEVIQENTNNKETFSNRVLITYVERNTSARLTDYFFHNNRLLTGEDLRGIVYEYFEN